MSQQYFPVPAIQPNLECDNMSRVFNSRHNSKSPDSVREELYCGPNYNFAHEKRSTLKMSSIYTRHSKSMSLKRPFISEPTTNTAPKNTGVIFRAKRMRSLSHEDASDERVIARARPIDSENFVAKDAHDYPTVYREENYSIENESPTLRICHQRYSNRTSPLFECNRLLPTLSE